MIYPTSGEKIYFNSFMGKDELLIDFLKILLWNEYRLIP